MSRPAEADDHALGEERVAVRTREEVPPAPSDHAVALGHRRENVLERSHPWPPELVGVGVQHPVGPEVRGGHARHPGHPRSLAHVVALLADQVEPARSLVALEDLGGAVLGAVVGRDDEVDARVQVIGDLRVDDVGLVAREQRHDELHDGQPRARSHVGREAQSVLERRRGAPPRSASARSMLATQE